MSKNVNDRLTALEGRFATLEQNNSQSMGSLRRSLDERLDQQRAETGRSLDGIKKAVGEELGAKLKSEFTLITDSQNASLDKMSNGLNNSLAMFSTRVENLEKKSTDSLELMRQTMERQLNTIREDNNSRLETIQQTVDEKLDRKLTDSFKQVSDQLESVYKGLGEMQAIASGVGDLRKVLSNVKNRGILGEMQLASILRDILAPEQYETEKAVVPRSNNRVEFAVKLPGADGSTVYLPIDSKFPGDRYSALQEAYDSGSTDAVKTAKKQLFDELRSCAKDISDKYIAPPHTTSFAIMFLPFEGLYAEAVNGGLMESLQREFNVNIAGPSTMAALLNSLQMGFRTLAIQKRSNEVWKVLGAVKTEFGKFGTVLEKTQKQLSTAQTSLDTLVGTRTNTIIRSLRDVEALPEDESIAVLGGGSGDTVSLSDNLDTND
ncbi:MAG: DNA recombination protein RmuC [Ruminococcus sp.]|nr:DNA recombination protein RmuC [Ruminococcus sp.]